MIRTLPEISWAPLRAQFMIVGPKQYGFEWQGHLNGYKERETSELNRALVKFSPVNDDCYYTNDSIFESLNLTLQWVVSSTKKTASKRNTYFQFVISFKKDFKRTRNLNLCGLTLRGQKNDETKTRHWKCHPFRLIEERRRKFRFWTQL